MELEDYNIKFVHMKGKHKILADAILRLKMFNIYKEPLEAQKYRKLIICNQLLQRYVLLVCTS